MSWDTLKEILAADYPGMAPATHASTGILMEILPELRAIDSLVVRDFYHRYTVTNHSLRTIETLAGIGGAADARGTQFAPVMENARAPRPADFRAPAARHGQGNAGENHVQGSLTALASAASRLGTAA